MRNSRTDGSEALFRESRKAAGSVTVFFALISAIVIALLLCVEESARTEGARLYMTIAANSSIDSLFSQYHRKLWEEYRLLGLEHYAYEQITEEMSGFMKPYLQADNWYPMEIEHIDMTDWKLLTEDDAEYYEEEVLDYMKYGIAASVWSLIEAQNYTDGSADGTSVNSLSDIYDGHEKEAIRLEEAIENIGSCLNDQKSDYSGAFSALSSYDGSGFISGARAMQADLSRIPGLVKKYVKQAEKMEEGLAESRQKLEAEHVGGDLTDTSYELLNADIEEYEAYVAEDGQRRREISAFTDRAESNKNFLDTLIAEAEEIEEYIANWEPDDEDDELDIEALWAPVISAFSAYDMISLDTAYGVADKEKEQTLENIKELINGNLLKLVLPEGAEVSSDALNMEEKPSETCFSGGNADGGEILDKLYFVEYIAGVMDYFGRGSYDKGSERTGSGSLETEYILFAENNDCANLTKVVERLVEIRTGLNLVYLYSDSEKKNEARALAMTITGAAGLLPLVTVVTFFIMSVWALAQAVCDVRDLLGGGRVPFIHDRSTFYLDLDGLMAFADGSVREKTGDQEKGLKYIDYLKILLLIGQNTEQDYRCMDVMQMVLRKEQGDFLMNRLIYSMETEVNVSAGHVFSELGISKANGADTGGKYGMSVSTAYSY